MPDTGPKIFIIGPSWVGDMVMAQTLFKTLKQNHPDAVIDVMAPAWSVPLMARMPEVNQGLVLPFGHGEWRLRDRYRTGKELRSAGYDHAYVLPNSWKSAIVPWAAKIPVRTGWLGEQRRILLNDARHLDKSRYSLMIERFAALAGEPDAPLPNPIPNPRFDISKAAIADALAKHALRVEAQPILALCPGSEFGSSKRWPPEYFATVANAKLAEGWSVWLFGSPKDREIANGIQEKTQNRCQDLTGKTSLSEAIDLMSLTHAVVTNDSGLMHIAAALDIPQVVPYGSTSPKFTPPLSDKATILSLDLECAPCFKRECPLQHHRCLRDLSPSMVLDALKKHQTPTSSSTHNNAPA